MDCAQSRNLFFFFLCACFLQGFADSVNESIAENFTVVQCCPTRALAQKKPWTIMIYIAGDNDLSPFIINNIKQLAQIGSNKNCNIVIQVSEQDKKRPTQRYLIEKGKAVALNKDNSERLDSGSDKTLLDFCSFAIDNFPSEHIALILWDHGTGYLDPFSSRLPKSQVFFDLNPDNLMMEIDRSLEFFEIVHNYEIGYHDGSRTEEECYDTYRGICFDESHRSYLTNYKLKKALEGIKKKFGKPIDILGLDACLMQMAEFALLIKPYCNIMVGSEEVELGWGWNYAMALEIMETKNPTPVEFAKQIVQAYKDNYITITPDFTLSAVNLKKCDELKEQLNDVAAKLMVCMEVGRNNNVKKIIQGCRSKKNCTCFEEPSYIDLGHFIRNIRANLAKISTEVEDKDLTTSLEKTLNETLSLIDSMVFSKGNGKKLYNATGISIYFPERMIHPSYENSPFARECTWIQFLTTYLSLP
jgi:hypothetical protein